MFVLPVDARASRQVGAGADGGPMGMVKLFVRTGSLLYGMSISLSKRMAELGLPEKSWRGDCPPCQLEDQPAQRKNLQKKDSFPMPGSE